MVRDRAHVDRLLAGMAEVGVDDVLVVSGDASSPEGPYASSEALVQVIAGHELRPQLIGITGYPEGHPLVEDDALERALWAKSQLADYVTTQMCFDAAILRGWIAGWRRRGMSLPVYLGVPGKVATARLLEMSARIGVGPSMAFLRKQRSLKDVFALLLRRSASDRLLRDVQPLLLDPDLAVAGLHYFTFNQLLATYEWQAKVPSLPQSRRRVCAPDRDAAAPPDPAPDAPLPSPPFPTAAPSPLTPRNR
jgi:methylenetetrahydrofolate reductase (NADPH)